MPAGSYNDCARLMLALPGRVDQLAKRTGMTAGGVSILLRRLWSLRLLHPGAFEIAGSHRPAVWLVGDGEANPGHRVRERLRPHAAHIAFATLWHGLEDGTTARALASDTGVSPVSVYGLLRLLRERQRAYIATWEKDVLGRPVAVWMLGTGRSEPKPKAREEAEQWRDRCRRRDYRLLQMGVAA